MHSKLRCSLVSSLILVLLLVACSADGGERQGDLPQTGSEASSAACQPTRADMLGPFYEPDAPLRERVGQGYVLSGTVRSAADCAGIENALVEFWMAGPDGEYAAEYRAAQYSGSQGEFQFESHFPPPYAGRPSHIHIRVTAPGYKELVTQHYPEQGSQQADFDLVLEEEASQ